MIFPYQANNRNTRERIFLMPIIKNCRSSASSINAKVVKLFTNLLPPSTADVKHLEDSNVHETWKFLISWVIFSNKILLKIVVRKFVSDHVETCILFWLHTMMILECIVHIKPSTTTSFHNYNTSFAISVIAFFLGYFYRSRFFFCATFLKINFHLNMKRVCLLPLDI